MKHGHSPISGYTRTYSSWKGMLQRCLNEKNPAYPNYGGRGITVFEGWLDFRNFLQDMGEAPFGQTLDRRDNSNGYCKENCRWASISTQNYNQRLRKDNKSGLKGVNKAGFRYYAVARVGRVLEYLYKGKDFFEACCARKSWEVKNAERF